MEPARKPPAALPPAAQTRRAHTVYFTDAEWAAITIAARRKFLDPSPFVRIAANRTVRMLRVQADEEAALELAEGWR